MDCVRQVIWYKDDGTPSKTWNCTNTGCVAGSSGSMTLTVFTKEDVSDLSPVSDCKYGDTVKLEKLSGYAFAVYEMAILGKLGNLLTVVLYIV